MCVFISRHPLFPLLALLLEKCELATQSIDCPVSDSLNADLQVFVQQQGREKKSLLTDNIEANELVSISKQGNSWFAHYSLRLSIFR